VIILAAGGELARLTALAFNRGDLMMVLACLLYAAYTIGLKRRPPVSALALLTVLAVAAFLSSIPLALAEAALGYYQWPTARGWAVVAGVAIIPSVISQACFIRGVTLIGPSRAGVFVNLVPVFAAILAVVFLHEPFEPYHALALALVLGGIAISERGKAG
jgi:drug/metabolite transporter (DMT)-like permease